MAEYDVLSEKLLLEKIAQGDELAFRLVFDLYKTKIYTFIVNFTHSRADAEEIVQDTFLTLWQNRNTLHQIEHPRNYIYTVVRNKTYHYLKQASKSQARMQVIWANLKLDSNETEETLQLQESKKLIDEALSMMSAQKQEVFRLSRYEGFSHEQIADATGLSKSRVKNIIVEVLKFIKMYIAQCTSILAIISWFTDN